MSACESQACRRLIMVSMSLLSDLNKFSKDFELPEPRAPILYHMETLALGIKGYVKLMLSVEGLVVAQKHSALPPESFVTYTYDRVKHFLRKPVSISSGCLTREAPC